ncbi:Thiol-disulfide oxidoreductase ResA [Anaerohalosphaera lusitana]|uniref:Thiol-disulfide oxidoreductase ResA n=1 Tax=Anaerohalosphaera lusitana TaxID=1936003 RepID=A0A1U9NIM3_9BACT|nr:TlpA disulfide reductase family protein [Anaerohalosphaera lusitana]AQT67779.1 Thiol-disulfide oxidoreductase ResA [Anaerohalosphaera lusitana]
MSAKKLTFAFITALFVFAPITIADGKVGEKAPDITVRQWLTPNSPDVKNLQGSPYVVEFWATWCKPCVKNIPHLVELNKKYRDSGLKILGLCQDKAPREINKLIRKNKIDYHVAIDNGSADWFAIRAYPTVMVVDHTGTITWRGLPWRSGFEKAIKAAIEKAPPQFLADIDLGPFADHKQALKGGKNFTKAYYDINHYASETDGSSKSRLAKKIVDRIDTGLQKQLDKAAKVSGSDPVTALCIYDQIARRYSGITPAIRAKILKRQLTENLHKQQSENKELAFFYNTARTTSNQSRESVD